jgi:hypothetical protein
VLFLLTYADAKRAVQRGYDEAAVEIWFLRFGLNDSLARARLVLQRPGTASEELVTDSGAVLEMAGN